MPVTKQVTLVYKISTPIYYEMSNPHAPIIKQVTPCLKNLYTRLLQNE